MKSLLVASVLAILPGLALAQEAPRDVSISSGEDVMSARLLKGVGEGPRPGIIMFNGFPSGTGIPRIASELQAAGYTVLLPQYRGTGTSGGIVSLQNSREDGAAAVSWLKEQDSTVVDTTKIGLLGVSYGGWVALQTAASDHSVRCVAALVPADMGVIGARWSIDFEYRSAWKTDLDGIAADPTSARFGPGGVDEFMAGAVADAERSGLTLRAPDFADRPVFVAGGRRDPAAPFAQHYAPFVEALRKASAPFAALEFDGGHNPSEASAAARSFIERRCFV